MTTALAKEYVGWATMRARQTLDYMQEGVRRGDATEAFIAAYGSEVGALVRFPASSVHRRRAARRQPRRRIRPYALTAPFDTPPTRNNSPSGVRTWRAHCPIC